MEARPVRGLLAPFQARDAGGLDGRAMGCRGQDGWISETVVEQTGFASVFDAAGEGLREPKVITGLPRSSWEQVWPLSEVGNTARTVTTPPSWLPTGLTAP